MNDYIYSFGMLLKVVTAFSILFILIPSTIICNEEESNGILDRIFISLIHSNLFIIFIVHFLAFIKLYETLSLIACCIIFLLSIYWFEKRYVLHRLDTFGMKVITRVLDLSDGNMDIGNELKSRLMIWAENFWTGLSKLFKQFFINPFGGLFLIIVLGAAAYVRFKHSIEHLYYAASDGYVHLTWAKYLGINDIYRDGVYPYGYESVISVLNKLFFLDPYFIVRFLGPIGSMLLVLSIYYVVYKIFGNDSIPAFIATLLYVAGCGLPVNVWRQMSALPQEYATIFFLPGLYFFYLFFCTGKRTYLFIAGETLALTVMIHPYVTVYLSIGYLVLCIVHINKLLELKRLLFLTALMISSLLAGLMPVIIGLLSGRKFHGSSINFMLDSVKIAENKEGEAAVAVSNISSPEAGNFTEDVFLLKVFLVCAGISILTAVILIFMRNRSREVDKGRAIIAFTVVSAIIYLLYRAKDLKLPSLMEEYRTGIFLSIIVVCACTFPFGIFSLFPGNKRLVYFLKVALCGIVVYMVLVYSSFDIPVGDRFEYDEAVQQYLNIKSNYPVLKWTIISTIEQYEQSLGYGWHYNLWEFIRDLSKSAEDKLIIPTNYIFLFVEKIPLGDSQPLSIRDSMEPFPYITGEASNYYKDRHSRRVLQAKAYFWAENYIKAHSNMNVFYDGPHLRVYMLEQEEQNWIDLLK